MTPQPENPFANIRKPTLMDVLCVGPIILYIVYIYATITITAPLLGPHPLLLSGLRGSVPAIINTGSLVGYDKLPFLVALLVPLPILMVSDPFYYWAGKRYGKPVISIMTGSTPKQIAKRVKYEHIFHKYGILMIVFEYYIPFPQQVFYVAAGESGIPFPLFLLADCIGTLLWIVLSVVLGIAFKHQAEVISNLITKYALWVTIALIAIVVIISVLRISPPQDEEKTSNDDGDAASEP